MNSAIFYKFSHPEPNILTMVAYDLDTMTFLPVECLQVDLKVMHSLLDIYKWVEALPGKPKLITNGSAYHYPLLVKMFGAGVDKYFHPTHIDINGLAMFLNVVGGIGGHLISNDEGNPSTSLQDQMTFYKIEDYSAYMESGNPEFIQLMNVVNVFVAHVTTARGG